jgi:hypothetical protein
LVLKRTSGLFFFSPQLPMANKKLGFGGQWVDGTPIGEHVDSDGDTVKIDAAFLEAVVANFEKTKGVHDVPITIDHPVTNAPAFGWVEGLRVSNGRLERRFADVNPKFEELVKAKAFRKRSDAFYLTPKDAPLGLVPALRHVGFLGAKIPAIKGIADIQFSADEGKTVDVEVDTAISFSEGEDMNEEQLKKTIGDQIKDFFKTTFGGGDPKAATAEFSESDRTKLTEDITAAIEAKFSEEKKTLDDKVKAMEAQLQTQVVSSTHDKNAKFCESLPGTVLPAMKKAGIVEFMDALDSVDVKKKITVITFTEEAGKEVEKPVEFSASDWFRNFLITWSKDPIVSFGESFGDLKLQGDGSDVVNPKRMDTMRSAINLPTAAEKASTSKS